MSVRVFPALRPLNTRSVPVIRRGGRYRSMQAEKRYEDANERPTRTETPLRTLIIGYFYVETSYITSPSLSLLLPLIKLSTIKKIKLSLVTALIFILNYLVRRKKIFDCA